MSYRNYEDEPGMATWAKYTLWGIGTLLLLLIISFFPGFVIGHDFAPGVYTFATPATPGAMVLGPISVRTVWRWNEWGSKLPTGSGLQSGEYEFITVGGTVTTLRFCTDPPPLFEEGQQIQELRYKVEYWKADGQDKSCMRLIQVRMR